jgi:predicted small secreted protein
MKRNALIVTIVACSVVLTACASIMHGTSQDIGISSSPTGASVTVDNMTKAQTPFVAKLSRKDNHVIHIAADGYAPADLTLTRSTSGWVWGNIVFGGLIGLAVDAMTGGLYNLTPEQLTTTLAKQSASIAPSKDGVYVVLVAAPEKGWTKVGQLRRLDSVLFTGN